MRGTGKKFIIVLLISLFLLGIGQAVCVIIGTPIFIKIEMKLKI